jgi:hypothetical protein
MAKKLNGLWRRRFSADCNKATRRFVVGSPPYDPGAYRRIGEWERSKVRFAADSLLEETGFEPSVLQPRFEDAVITVLTARRFFADIGAARQARRFIAAYRIGLADCAPQDYARPEQESDLFF